MSEKTYYERNRYVILNRAKNYYKNDKERLREQARYKYRNLYDINTETYMKKKIKREKMEKTDIITCLKKKNKD